MLTESTDETTLQERYDMLKSLCRQQILVNETLKSEISKLRNLLRKVSAERNLLLDELLDKQGSCRASSKLDSKADIKSKLNSQVLDKRSYSQVDDRHFVDAKKSKSVNPWNGENLDVREDYPSSNLGIDAPISNDSTHFSGKGRSHFQVTQQVSSNVNKSGSGGLINAIDEKPRQFITNSNWHSSNQSGSNSPPIISTGSRLSQSPHQSSESITQKTSKLGSLVTNSSLSSANTSAASFNLSQRQTGLNQTKYVSMANHSVKFVGQCGIGRAEQPTSTMLKTAISPPISPNIRLSTSGLSNQRIMIQPSKGPVRSIIVPRTQHSISDPPFEYGYTG